MRRVHPKHLNQRQASSALTALKDAINAAIKTNAKCAIQSISPTKIFATLNVQREPLNQAQKKYASSAKMDAINANHQIQNNALNVQINYSSTK